MIRPGKLFLAFTAFSTVACVGSEDNPTMVKDFRVLGIALEPPELMAPSCEQSPQALSVFGSQVKLKALLADPKGNGRLISYELFACASVSDRTCSTTSDRALLASQTTGPGELELDLTPGVTVASDGKPLLEKVAEQDSFKGLGGLRTPLVLHAKASDEEIFAQKLMVFSCKYFPEMAPNVSPSISGLHLRGVPWNEQEIPVVQSADQPIRITPTDFSAQQESFVVPSFELSPVHLVESWKISWHTDFGRLSPGETGGTDLGGEESRHRVEWSPPNNASEKEFTVWAVVRDGRGGESWLARRARYVP